MPVSPLTALAIFIVWWWLALFMVLPIGVKGLGESGEALNGADPGAPVAPNLKRKAIWALGLAAVFWTATMVFIRLNPLGFER